MTNKEQFVEIFKNNITRRGAAELLEWLEGSDFFTAPASTKFHLACEEGLLVHSLHVYHELKEEIEMYKNKPNAVNYSDETIAIVSLLHDLCKVNFYTTEIRNKKDESGKWVQVPFYTIDDKLPYGHGEKSALIVSRFLHLTTEELMAIRWHMGGFDDSAKGGSYAITNAFNMFPLCSLLHVADLKASYLDEAE